MQQPRVAVEKQRRYVTRRDARYHSGTSENGRPSRHECLWRKAFPIVMVPEYKPCAWNERGQITVWKLTGYKKVVRRTR